MGNNAVKYNIESKIWSKAYTHEYTTNPLERTNAISSYSKNSLLSLGKTDKEKINKRLNGEFELIEKGWGYIDAERKSYSIKKECCLTDKDFISEDGIIFTCDPIVKVLDATSYCDDVLSELCYNQLLTKDKILDTFNKCPVWIKSTVAKNKPILQYLLSVLADEDYISHEFTKTLLNSLREFATSENNFNLIADKIINSYSSVTKKKYYKCAFSPENIVLSEREQRVNKECWYKECVLAETYKLLTENIKKRKECVVTICDINIKNLDIGNNDLKIICQNKFNKNKIEIEDIPIIKDQETPFFIPTYINVLIPLFILLFLILH